MSISFLLFLFHIHLFLCVLTLVTCILIDWLLLYWCTVPHRLHVKAASPHSIKLPGGFLSYCCFITLKSATDCDWLQTCCQSSTISKATRFQFIAYFCLNFGHAVERILHTKSFYTCKSSEFSLWAVKSSQISTLCAQHVLVLIPLYRERESQPVLGGWRESAAVSFRFTHQPRVCISLDTSLWHFSLFIFMLIHFFNHKDKKHFYC